MLYTVTRNLYQLICCKLSPEDLPYSMPAFWGVLGLNAVWQFLGIVGQLGIANALLWAMAPIGLMALFLWGTLRLRRQDERFFKIFMALQGANILIEMIVWLATLVVPYRGILVLVGGMWQLTVMGHILQYGLEIARWKAVLMSLGFIMGLGFMMMPAVLALNVAGAPV